MTTSVPSPLTLGKPSKSHAQFKPLEGEEPYERVHVSVGSDTVRNGSLGLGTNGLISSKYSGMEEPAAKYWDKSSPTRRTSTEEGWIAADARVGLGVCEACKTNGERACAGGGGGLW